MLYPSSFPIDPVLPDLKEAIRAHPAVILQAPPGSGKTTRVPLALLEIFPPGKGRIVMLEPRRLAAVAAARWMARGLGEKIGRTLGYSIRFDSRVTDQTRIELVTEGILTRRITADPLLIKSFALGCPRLGADLAALLSERDIRRPEAPRAGRQTRKGSGLGERLDLLQDWRKGKQVTPATDPFALQAVDRVTRELSKTGKHRSGIATEEESTLIPRLLVQAYPDRLAQKRAEGVGRFHLARGPGVRLAAADPLAASPFIVALQVEGGQGSEGRVHLAEPVSEALIRKELGDRIETIRRVEWDKKEGRIISVLEERLGSLVLSVKPLSPAQEEAAHILCAEIRSAGLPFPFRPEARQLQGRVRLLGRTFPIDIGGQVGMGRS